uniref:Reverse transcriptase/retrotransposon-derived protein RNase H-like domain-containing protein n=1 Tax=Cyprinus carpio TaxID=7962 RepID=A0A8C2HZS1_CYPCA
EMHENVQQRALYAHTVTNRTTRWHGATAEALGLVMWPDALQPTNKEMDVEFAWQPAQQQAFDKLKDLCTKSPVLLFFYPSKPVEIFCDASSNGLGAVLLQDSHPVAFSSRSLTNTETHCTKKELSCLQQTIRQGWPGVMYLVQPFWDSRSQLVVADAADGQATPQQPACCPSAAHTSSVRPPQS